ncbi:MAG TPA: glycosyltransferase [Methanoregulaceae archaeon]|nr:glycosyltransferase [Methanoregulaceae archaeon]
MAETRKEEELEEIELPQKIHVNRCSMDEMDVREVEPQVLRSIVKGNTKKHDKVRALLSEKIAQLRFIQKHYHNIYRYKSDTGISSGSVIKSPETPLISVVIPVHNGPPQWLECAIQSVLEQTYSRWELCIVDDSSTEAGTLRLLSRIKDPRIIIKFLKTNVGISSATNVAISSSKGEYITFLDQDDELTNDALAEIVNAVNRYKPDLIYSDEDKFADSLFGRKYIDAHFKPDYSPDLLLSHNYITHLLVVKRALMDKIGVFRPEYDGAQDYDLTLRAVESADTICHIRKVLYHWRYHRGSTSHQTGSREKCSDAGRRAVEDAMLRRKINAIVEPTKLQNHYRVLRKLKGEPLVSIIIPFNDMPQLLDTCLHSIISRTTYSNYEILGINNNSKEKKTFDLMARWTDKDQRVRFVDYNSPFNYSEINNYAVRFARGDYLILLNNDVEIITTNWIETLLEHAQRDEVGVVGGKLYYPDGTVQHAGIVVGIKGFAGRPHRRFPGESTGYFHRLMLTQNVSAATGALMMVNRSKYLEVGGMDSINLPISLNDVDFCLRLMEKRYWNVFTPYCEAIHAESVSRGFDTDPGKRARFEEEIKYFTSRHQKILSQGDPFYNPNLSLDDEDIRYRNEPYLGEEKKIGCFSKKAECSISNRFS